MTEFNANPLGTFEIQITGWRGDSTVTFTCRRKDQDLTAVELRAVAQACMDAAAMIDSPPAGSLGCGSGCVGGGACDCGGGA